MKNGKLSKVYNSILFDLEKVEGVKTIALGSRDGFLIDDCANDNTEMLTQMSATMLKAAEAVTCKYEKVCPSSVVVDFKGGKLITASAGPKALISVMASQDAGIDPIISELERTAGKIREIL